MPSCISVLVSAFLTAIVAAPVCCLTIVWFQLTILAQVLRKVEEGAMSLHVTRDASRPKSQHQPLFDLPRSIDRTALPSI